MGSEIQILSQEALQLISSVVDIATLEQIRIRYLGKKSPLAQALKDLQNLSVDERRALGQAVNTAKQHITEALTERKKLLLAEELSLKLAREQIDVTLPGRGQEIGGLHPITRVRNRVVELFTSLGFEIVEGPEVETDYYNFKALNFAEHHPARDMQDTFYFSDGHLLRTHTSPIQIRAMEERRPPLRLITLGKVFRCDSDMTHTPMFHQVEGFMIGENVNMSELKGMLTSFFRTFFENNQLNLRLRPSFFPFVEPGAEVDIECVFCHGKGCRTCSQQGWLEVMGCGMVHPNVLQNVHIDPEYYQGWAFGGGLDRLTMLRYGINDLRLLFENDLRLLTQFKG